MRILQNLVFIFSLFIFLLDAGRGFAQGGWSTTEVLFAPEPGWKDLGTELVADRAGFAHLVWVHYEEDTRLTQFYYARWDGSVWTVPVDILVSAAGDIGWPALVAADDGRLHLFWYQGFYICHAWAWSIKADCAHCWSSPRVIATVKEHWTAALDAIQDEYGVFHVVYPQRGGDCYYIRSEDGGETWSQPKAISAVSWDVTTYLPKVSAADGRIHVVWTETQNLASSFFSTLRVNYAYSSDSGTTWSLPLQIAGQKYSDGNVVAVKGGVVHLLWNGGVGPGGRYYMRSEDGGETWSTPVRLSALAGQAGYPSLAFDSTGKLHVCTADGEYVSGDGYSWSLPVRLPFYQDLIEQSRLVVVRGKQLLAISPRHFAGIYYVTKLLDVPAIQVVTPVALTPVLTPSPMPGSVSEIVIPGISSRNTGIADEWVIAADVQLGKELPIILGVGGALVVVGCSIAIAKVRSK